MRIVESIRRRKSHSKGMEARIKGWFVPTMGYLHEGMKV